MLGMDVHDWGPHWRRMPRALAEGMVLTSSPDFQEDDLLVPAELRGIGIRIEDDIHRDRRRHRNLSRRCHGRRPTSRPDGRAPPLTATAATDPHRPPDRRHSGRGRPIIDTTRTRNATPARTVGAGLALCACLAAAGCFATNTFTPAGDGSHHRRRDDGRATTRTPPPGTDQTPTTGSSRRPTSSTRTSATCAACPPGHRGDPNSWTLQLQRYIRAFLDEIAATDQGRCWCRATWSRDAGARRHRERHLRAGADRGATGRGGASGAFYSTYVQRFAERGLTLHAAPATTTSATTTGTTRTRGRRSSGATYLSVFKHATRSTKAVREATVRHPPGAPVRGDVLRGRSPRRPADHPRRVPAGATATSTSRSPAPARLAAHDAQRAQAQAGPVGRRPGHNPVLWPVREVSSSSGGHQGAEDSPLWRTMARYSVDPLPRRRGATRPCGGRPDGVAGRDRRAAYRGDATYLVATAYDDRLDLEVRPPGDRAGPKPWRPPGCGPARGPTSWVGKRPARLDDAAARPRGRQPDRPPVGVHRPGDGWQVGRLSATRP